MEFIAFLRERLADGALLPNLIAAAALALAVQVPSWGLRRLLRSCGSGLTSWTGSDRLGTAGKEAARRAEAALFWLTLAAVALVLVGGVAYHLGGRDVRADLHAWTSRQGAGVLLHGALRLAGAAAVGAILWFAMRWLRRARLRLQDRGAVWVTEPGREAELYGWLVLVEQFAVAGALLGAAWTAGQILGLPGGLELLLGLAVRLTLILAAARLLPRASRLFAGLALTAGDRRLGQGRPGRYWERVRQLLPFGQRCFEAAVWVYAASLAVRVLHFIPIVADYGPRLVVCIGILFGCRVVVEFSQVLLNELFGLYDERRSADQKGQTLVPLLHSVCQYVLYFGALVAMLGALGVNTAPILAGAGLLGLVVGLGSQSLVTDVVSGFFILFEGQYLVGDTVEIGDARGRVEVISIRHTQIRDSEGRLHLIPNGQIKGVVNSSKGYINAVVDLRLPAEADLSAFLEAMREAGRRLRREHSVDVLADTDVQGPVDLGPAELTARAVTRVRPGKHLPMQNEYRRLFKQVLDERRPLIRPAA